MITGERLTTLFRPRSVALAGASDKSVFSTVEALDAVVTWTRKDEN
jgi:hypothetical protein